VRSWQLRKRQPDRKLHSLKLVTKKTTNVDKIEKTNTPAIFASPGNSGFKSQAKGKYNVSYENKFAFYLLLK
jgi:hypothetical protein